MFTIIILHRYIYIYFTLQIMLLLDIILNNVVFYYNVDVSMLTYDEAYYFSDYVKRRSLWQRNGVRLYVEDRI